jgi:hypothetical protein
MLSTTDPGELIGETVYDRDHDKIGTINQVYLDSSDGRPTWASVRTGLFGLSETFVPLDDATENDDEITVAYEKDFVKDAPRIDPDGDLDDAQQDELYRYYESRRGDAAAGGMIGAAAAGATGAAGTSADSGAARNGAGSHDTGAPGAGTAGYGDTGGSTSTGTAAGTTGYAGPGTSGSGDFSTSASSSEGAGAASDQPMRARLHRYVAADAASGAEPVGDGASGAHDGSGFAEDDAEGRRRAEGRDTL